MLLSTGVFILLVQNIVFQLDEEDMDSFVLVVGQKKALLKMQKEYEDLVSLWNFDTSNFFPSTDAYNTQCLSLSLSLSLSPLL